ncbi:uncharacterized protein METZ01_LOCUS135001, partial [marine metagenome]
VISLETRIHSQDGFSASAMNIPIPMIFIAFSTQPCRNDEYRDGLRISPPGRHEATFMRKRFF